MQYIQLVNAVPRLMFQYSDVTNDLPSIAVSAVDII